MAKVQQVLVAQPIFQTRKRVCHRRISHNQNAVSAKSLNVETLSSVEDFTYFTQGSGGQRHPSALAFQTHFSNEK